jgi:hypothetical protein
MNSRYARAVSGAAQVSTACAPESAACLKAHFGPEMNERTYRYRDSVLFARLSHFMRHVSCLMSDVCVTRFATSVQMSAAGTGTAGAADADADADVKMTDDTDAGTGADWKVDSQSPER